MVLLWPGGGPGGHGVASGGDGARPQDLLLPQHHRAPGGPEALGGVGLEAVEVLAPSLALCHRFALPARVLGEARGEPLPLVQACALEAFFDMQLPALTQLAKYLAAPTQSSWSVVEQCEALVKYVLPELTQEGLVLVLEKRGVDMQQTDLATEDDPLLRDLLPDEDLQELEEHRGATEKKHKLSSSFKARVATLLKPAPQPAPQAKKKARREKAAPPPPGRQRALAQPPPPGEDIPEGDALQWLPQDCSIHKDLRNGRWRVQVPHVGSLSRSFQLHGFRRAFAICCKWAWDQSMGAEAESCPHQWVLAELQET